MPFRAKEGIPRGNARGNNDSVQSVKLCRAGPSNSIWSVKAFEADAAHFRPERFLDAEHKLNRWDAVT